VFQPGCANTSCQMSALVRRGLPGVARRHPPVDDPLSRAPRSTYQSRPPLLAGDLTGAEEAAHGQIGDAGHSGRGGGREAGLRGRGR
jgi:hypothetical protein